MEVCNAGPHNVGVFIHHVAASIEYIRTVARLPNALTQHLLVLLPLPRDVDLVRVCLVAAPQGFHIGAVTSSNDLEIRFVSDRGSPSLLLHLMASHMTVGEALVRVVLAVLSTWCLRLNNFLLLLRCSSQSFTNNGRSTSRRY